MTGEHDHPKLGYWSKYIFSVDHKIIGIQYAITALCFLLFGFCLMMLMRWQLAYPGEPIPIIGTLLGEALTSGGILLPEGYNSLRAMHGTILVVLGVVPLAVGGLGGVAGWVRGDEVGTRVCRTHGMESRCLPGLLGSRPPCLPSGSGSMRSRSCRRRCPPGPPGIRCVRDR